MYTVRHRTERLDMRQRHWSISISTNANANMYTQMSILSPFNIGQVSIHLYPETAIHLVWKYPYNGFKQSTTKHG